MQFSQPLSARLLLCLTESAESSGLPRQKILTFRQLHRPNRQLSVHVPRFQQFGLPPWRLFQTAFPFPLCLWLHRCCRVCYQLKPVRLPLFHLFGRYLAIKPFQNIFFFFTNFFAVCPFHFDQMAVFPVEFFFVLFQLLPLLLFPSDA